MMTDDQQSLECFARNGSEAAFGRIVSRYVGLVYSAALRQVGGDAHLAKDVAQLVFTNLARKAPELCGPMSRTRRDPCATAPERGEPRGEKGMVEEGRSPWVLAGWLHRDTRYTALEILRRERRRRAREQEAATMQTFERDHPPSDWTQIRPLLDELLDQLGGADRDALLLRFFEQRSLAEVGKALGTGEDAARKRVSRALDKLRGLLASRGITTTASALSLVLATQSSETIPNGLDRHLAGKALAATGAVATSTLGILTLLNSAKTTTVIVASAVLLFVGGAVVTWYKSTFDENQAATLPSADPAIRIAVAGTNRLFPPRSASSRAAADSETDPGLAAALAKVQEALNDPRPTPRYPNPVMQEALAALGSNGQGAVPLLRNALRNALLEPGKHENMLVIYRAADALGLIGPEARDAVPDLLELLRADLSDMDARASINALTRVGPELPEILPDLVQLLKDKRTARFWIAATLPTLSGGDAMRVDGLVRPLLRDANIQVRVAAADVLWNMLKSQAGPDVTKVAIEALNSVGEDFSLFTLRMLGILQSAAQNPNDPGRLTAANLGAAAGEAIAALIHVANTSKHESVKAQALELLDGLAPGFRKANSGMDALLTRREQVNAFVERIRSGQATAPELIDGLKQFPGMAHSATEALVRLGPQVQAVLPALRDTLAALDPNPGDNAQVPGAGYPARAAVANAIQRMAPDQPKLLFTSEDVSSVIGIWLGPASRWLDTDRHARISQALRPAMAYLMDHGHQMPPDQMQKVLETLKEVDQPAYEAASAEVKKIDPQFVEKGRSPSKPVE